MFFTDIELEQVSKVVGYHTARPSRALYGEELRARLLLWLCEHYETVKGYRKTKRGVAKLKKALRHETFRQEAKERKAINLRDTVHDCTWSSAEIKRHLTTLGDLDGKPTSDGALVEGAFYSLSEKHRELLWLSYVERMSVREVANLRGHTERTVITERLRAVNIIKAKLNGLREVTDFTNVEDLPAG